jgi:hypothetical protein
MMPVAFRPVFCILRIEATESSRELVKRSLLKAKTSRHVSLLQSSPPLLSRRTAAKCCWATIWANSADEVGDFCRELEALQGVERVSIVPQP